MALENKSVVIFVLVTLGFVAIKKRLTAVGAAEEKQRRI
jgi:hypothetical protein